MGYSYFELLTMLLDSLESDTTIPKETKDRSSQMIHKLEQILWAYSD